MKFENIRVLVNDEWSGVMHAEWVTDGGAGGIGRDGRISRKGAGQRVVCVNESLPARPIGRICDSCLESEVRHSTVRSIKSNKLEPMPPRIAVPTRIMSFSASSKRVSKVKFTNRSFAALRLPTGVVLYEDLSGSVQ